MNTMKPAMCVCVSMGVCVFMGVLCQARCVVVPLCVCVCVYICVHMKERGYMYISGAHFHLDCNRTDVLDNTNSIGHLS